MKKTAIISVLLIVCMALTAAAQEAVWQAGFSQPNAGFEPYRDDGGTTLEMMQVDDVPVLHVTTAGVKALEGACINVGPQLEPGLRYTFKAEVRGSGQLWVIANSRNGWLYSSATVDLTDRWQDVMITKPLAVNDDRMRVCLLTKEAGELDMQIRSASAIQEPAPQTYDRSVTPVRFEAEEVSVYPDRVRTIEGASGGQGCQDGTYMYLAGIPTPRTSRPIYVYVRAKMPDADAYCSVRGATQSGAQRLNKMSTEVTDKWQWLSGEPVSAAAVGDTISLQIHGAKTPSGNMQVDAVAVSTEAELSADVLDSAPIVPLTDAPMFSAVRADTAPTLDGKADDACWQQAPVLSHFVKRSNFNPARHASQVQFSYDEDHLYFFFRGEEPVLRPEENKLHEFKKDVTTRDDRVYTDDSVMLLLDPQQGSEKFDFTINAIGTVNDARIPGEDLWRSRETDFDADIESESVIGDGFWTLEAAISFESLGVTPPAAGDSWRAIFGRIEQADDETSSWNLCHEGFHDSSAWAGMQFVESAPQATFTLPDRLQLGDNDITVDVRADGAEGGYYAYSRVERRKEFATDVGFAPTSPEGSTATTTVTLEEEGEIALEYGLWDAVTLRPLVLSPSYPRSVKSSSAMVRIVTDSPYTLYLNGSVVARGQSATADDQIQAFLQKGINAFGIELEEGTAQVEIGIGDWYASSSDSWRVAPEDVEDFSAPRIDDRDWEHAPTHDGGRLGKYIGNPDGPSRMRMTVLWEQTRVFPNPTPALYVAQGTKQHFTIAANGIPGHVLEDYRLQLMLPEGLTLTGVTAYYNAHEHLPEYTIEKIADEFPVEDQNYALYEIRADQPIPYKESVRILELFNVFIEWDEAAGDPEDRPYMVRYAARANEGSIYEAWQTFPVRILPPLQGRQPQELTWQLWGSFFSAMNKDSMKEATMETMKQAGFNDIVSGDRVTSQIGDRLGIENVKAINFEPWSINMEPYIEQHPDTALIDGKGETSEKYVCTTELLDGARQFVTDRIHEIVADSEADVVNWDYESNPMTSYISCFCPKCLAAFREHAGIDANVELDGPIIEEQYRDEWIDFMTLRMARVARMFKEATHSAEGSPKFVIYSGYHSPDTKWRYGVDWKYIADLEACDIASCGYGRDWDAVMATHEALQGIPLIVGKLMRPYDRNSNDIPSPATKAVLMRRLMDSTAGVLVYDRMPLDGRAPQAILMPVSIIDPPPMSPKAPIVNVFTPSTYRPQLFKSLRLRTLLAA
ncbi:MAG: hypothetical protein R6V19_13735 [Armatimonadota bacterium]